MKRIQVNLSLDRTVNEHLTMLANMTRRNKGAMVSWLVDKEWMAMVGEDVLTVDVDSLPKKEEEMEEVVTE